MVRQVQYIGYFDSEEEAALAYDRDILRVRPAAQTNFPAAPAAPAAQPQQPAVDLQPAQVRLATNDLTQIPEP